MKPKQTTPLTLVEAEREFTKVGRAFNAYLEKTKHLGKISICSRNSVAPDILDRIKHHYLGEGFKVRDITHEHSWAGLKEQDVGVEGLKLLCASNWISSEIVQPGIQGGRPTIIFHISPACYRIGGFGGFGPPLLGAFFNVFLTIARARTGRAFFRLYC